jgi:uncharacterized membrane protein
MYSIDTRTDAGLTRGNGRNATFALAGLRQHAWLLISALLLAGIAVLSAGLVRDALLPTRPVLGFIAGAGALLIEVAALLALVRIGLNIRDSGTSDLWPFVDCADLVFTGVGAVILVALSVLVTALPFALLAVFLGLLSPLFDALRGPAAVLAVVAALVALYRLSHYLYFLHIIVDRRAGAIGALQASSALTAGKRLGVFGLLIALIAVNTLGMLFAGFGLLLTVPLSLLLLADSYRKTTAPEQAMPRPNEPPNTDRPGTSYGMA